MTDLRMAAQLAATYDCRISAWWPLPGGGEEQTADGIPCAVSRRAENSAPTPPVFGAAMPEALYRLAVYTQPEVRFRLGDRLEITDVQGRLLRGWASDSFCYPSHAVTVAAITEVCDR